MNQNQTKTCVDILVGAWQPGALGGSRIAGIKPEGASAEYSGGTDTRNCRTVRPEVDIPSPGVIRPRFFLFRIRPGPAPAPFRGISQHVVKTPAVGLFLTYG